MEVVDSKVPQSSILVITKDLDVTEQVELALDSSFSINTQFERDSGLFQDQAFIDSPVIIYDLDERGLEIAKTDVLNIKKNTPSKAIILVGDKETINTFINGDFEYLVFRVFAKPLRPKQMQLLLNSAFATISDRSSDTAINDMLAAIKNIEDKNQTSFLKNYKIIASVIIVLLVPILYFLFSSADKEDFSNSNRPQLSETPQSQPSPSPILEADGSFSPGESLLIVGTLESDPDPLVDAEDDALLAELDAADNATVANQETNRNSSSTSRSTTSVVRNTTPAPRVRTPAPRNTSPAPRNTTPAPVVRNNTASVSAPRAAETANRAESIARQQPIQQSSNQQTLLAAADLETPTQEAQSEASLGTENSPVISPPVLISKVNPRYPRSAFSRGVEGWVDINIKISDEGDVTDVEIVDSEPGRLFVRSVRSAVEDWKYNPALNTTTQTPVESIVQELRISFKIQN